MPRKLSVGGMGGRGKAAPMVKKVSPPTVPDTVAATHRYSGSSFNSVEVSGSGGTCDHGQLYHLGAATNTTTTSTTTTGGSGCAGSQPLPSSSPSHYSNQQHFAFSVPPHQQQMPQFVHLMCSKTSPSSPHHLPPDGTYAYLTYQHQTSLEDQGIDVQSPGRSSPGSGSGSSTTGSTASSGGCRNSTTSLDSGRASTTTHSHQHRLSGQSYDSGSILRHSYHSSSSSLGSLEHDSNTPHINVLELLNNGVRDSEVLRAWLIDLRFEEYYDKFMAAGYDIPTISRMTPEDLNAIGITKPAHRKKLKAEITRLNISDGLPDFIPGRLEDWLSLLHLEEYTASLNEQKYVSVEQMTQLTWEDLEEIGIKKLGHQKKVMLAIKRVKDILAGKTFNTSQDHRQQSTCGTHEIIIPREPCEGHEQFTGISEFKTFSCSGNYGNGDSNRISVFSEAGPHYGVAPHYSSNLQCGSVPPSQAHVHPVPQLLGQFHQPCQHRTSQGLSPPGSKLHNGHSPSLPGPGQVQYCPDVVAVQVRPGGRGRSVEALEEPIYGTYQTFHPDTRMPHGLGSMSVSSPPPWPFPPSNLNSSHPQRSMDDGDITPTNEYANSYEGGGTLPRPRTANKFRPVAKVTAKTRADVHEVPQFIKDGMNLKKTIKGEESCMKELKTLNHQNSEKNNKLNQGGGSSNNTPQGTPKKVPPPPPRRSNSVSESTKESAIQGDHYGYLHRGLSYGYMGIKNNLQPDITPDLPPPPAPPDSANHQHLPDDFPPPPPPLTCVTMASGTHKTASSTVTTTSGTSDSLTCQTCPTSSDDDPSTGFLPRRNDSNASFKSTSSTDSESLPFANENAGTIKQRSCRTHSGLTMLDTCNSPHSSPHSSPALCRKETQPPLGQDAIATAETFVGQLSKSNPSSPDGTGDVLNDIGNMLANLTDELDAMLEQEVTLKN